MAAQTKFISGHTHMMSLIGSPVEHSKSPIMHSVSFEHAGVDALCLAFDVQPEDVPTVLDAMRAMGGWDGSSVTMPIKETVVEYLDELTDAAELIGAVNMIHKTEDGKLIGNNTDGGGFTSNLRNNGVDPKGKTVTLLGPGGAGSAVAAQLALDGVVKLHIFSLRDDPCYERTRDGLMVRIKEKTDCDVQLHTFDDNDALVAAINESDILINATPVGMGEGNTQTVIDTSLIKEGMVVADTIYVPAQTQFLKDAAAKGCKTISGSGMMDAQAVLGEKFLYGIDMDIDYVNSEIE